MSTIKLVLPYPISANRYWASRAYIDRRTKKAMSVTYVTEDAKAYRTEVGWRAKAAGCRLTNRPIEIVSVTLIPKNGVVINLDNCLKVTLDALNGVAYEDDRQIRRIGNVEYAAPDGVGGLVVEIREFEPPAPPLFAQ